MALDTFNTLGEGWDAPASNAVEIVPSDTVDLATTPRWLHIGVAGALKVHMKGASTPVTFTNVPAGRFDIRVDRIFALGTTASGIVALY